MSKSFDDLIYDSGLIASGCWEDLDTYTQEAIERLFQMTVLECGVALSPMLRDMISRGQAVELIQKHFGVER
jgi:hypothetical protein